MENLKKDLFYIRGIIDTMDWLLEGTHPRPENVKLYMTELKKWVNVLEKHSKVYHRQYDVLELIKMQRDELNEIAKHYSINFEEMAKRTVIYAILDKQRAED